MIKTDIKKEIKKLTIDEDVTLAESAEKAGTSKQYASRMLAQGNIVLPVFVKLVEAIGYDIEMKFVKRGDE